MPDLKVLLITANAVLSKAVSGAFASMFIQLSVVAGCAKLLTQDKSRYALVLLDMDCLGADKMGELKAFLSRVGGLPVLAMCDMTRISSREAVEILSSGVNDMMPNAIDMNVLVAKTRSHLRRIGVNNPANDRAAENMNRQ